MPAEWKPAHLTMQEVLARQLRSFLPRDANLLEEQVRIQEVHGRHTYQVTTTLLEEGVSATYRLCDCVTSGTDPLELEWTALERLE